MPAAKRPFVGGLSKTMMNGVVMYIGNQANEVLIRIDEFAVEVWYKKASFPVIHLV